MMPPQQLGQLYERAAARGHGLPVAVAIGNHPAELVAGATTVALGDDELGLAGALRGEPTQLARCVTIDLEVPARAEIVLEGEVLAGVAEPEGPYGDFMQFYVPVMPNRVLRLPPSRIGGTPSTRPCTPVRPRTPPCSRSRGRRSCSTRWPPPAPTSGR